jgi:large subunit ribosomal protein L4
LWRHGGVVFGPHPRDFGYSLSPKVKAAALRTALRAKGQSDSLTVLEQLSFTKTSTKEAASLLRSLKLNDKKVLVVCAQFDATVRRSLRNIEGVSLALAKDVHAYEVMNSASVLITKDALSALTKRLQK